MITAMKKNMIAAVLAAVLLTGCGISVAATPLPTPTPFPKTEEKVVITNLVDFNVLEDPANMEGYQWMDSYDTSFTEISLKESIRFFTEKGSGILVYSAPNCPFCNRAMPILSEVLQEYGIRAYYVDTSQQIASDMATSMELYNELCSYISSIFEKDEDGEPMFQIPEVIAIKDGEITGHHLSLVDSFTLVDSESQMDETQKEELRNIYRRLIETCAD